MESYLPSILQQFAYYKMLGDKSLAQVSDQALLQDLGQDNNLPTLVKHLWGNMLSRWTDFLNSDGEKTWRERDAEFEAQDLQSRQAVLEKWEAGWACLFEALHSLKTEDLERIVYIRNQGHTVLEAINRQLAHYAYHVGQMVFIAKHLQGENWASLSIPKAGSQAYNAEKFAQEKTRQHFTQEFLDKP